MADRSDSRPWRAGLLALALLTAVVVLVEGRGTTFFYDEWDFLLGRRGTSLHTLLDPQNGNLSLVPVVLFKLLLQVFGTDGYPAWRVVLLVLHLAVVGLAFGLLRRRVGDGGAAVGAALVLVLGRSADNLIWPAQFGYVTAAIGGLIALVGVDRRNRGGDLLILAGLTLGLASSSNALPLYVAVVISLLLVRPQWPRLWAAFVPAVLYALWSVGYGASQFDWANVPKTPDFASTMAATAAGGAFGLSADFGRAIAVVLLVALAAWLVRGGRATPRLWGCLAGLVAVWVLAGFARASIEDPTAPRFVYVAVLLGVLAAGEVLATTTAGAAVRRELLAAPRAAAATLVLVAFCALAGWGALHARANDLRAYADEAKAQLGALDLAASYVPSTYQPVPRQPQITAGPVLAAERDFGDLGDSRRELATAPLDERNDADQALREVGAIALAAGGTRAGTQPPAVVGLTGVSQVLRTGVPCVQLTPGPNGGTATLAGLPGQRFLLTVPGQVAARAWRFGAAPSAVTALVPEGSSTLVLRPDAPGGEAVRPWLVQLQVPARVTACVAG